MPRYFNLAYYVIIGCFFLFATYRVPVDLYPVFSSTWDDVAGGGWFAVVASALCSAVCFNAAVLCGVQLVRTLRSHCPGERLSDTE